ncbi:MAG: hypothetical protein ACP5RF_03950 [Candidatus Micrarchaeia archaeon]
MVYNRIANPNAKGFESKNRFLFYVGIKALITNGKRKLILSSGKGAFFNKRKRISGTCQDLLRILNVRQVLYYETLILYP